MPIEDLDPEDLKLLKQILGKQREMNDRLTLIELALGKILGPPIPGSMTEESKKSHTQQTRGDGH